MPSYLWSNYDVLYGHACQHMGLYYKWVPKCPEDWRDEVVKAQWRSPDGFTVTYQFVALLPVLWVRGDTLSGTNLSGDLFDLVRNDGIDPAILYTKTEEYRE